MFVFLLLCAFLQTLQGKPLPSLAPSSGVAANVTCVTALECPAVPDTGQQLRTAYDIVKTCLFTIFACVWTSIHPNINGPRDSWWARIKRRAITTFYAVIAPEMILLWALQQRSAAKDIADGYNSKFSKSAKTKTSILQKIPSLFRPLPKQTTWRGDGQSWTTTHGFFIQMGGFILYENGYPKEVLSYYRLTKLLEDDAIDAPTVTERELKDRGKGDTISKAIVVLQTSWFVLQCIVRTTQGLPLSELEVLTLAFAVMNAAIYTAWWSKPQGVHMAVCVPLRRVENTGDNFPPRSRQTDDQHFDDDEPLMESHKHTDQDDSWPRRKLREDRENHSFLVFLLFCLPHRTVLWLIHPMAKVFGSSKPIREGLHVPMFYFGTVPTFFPEQVAGTVGITFGAIHLLGWPLEFPLPSDRILWHISAIALTAIPFVFVIGVTLYAQDRFTARADRQLILIPVGVLAPFYIAARFIIITIAFKSIGHPPPNVLVDVAWTRYIPHF